MKKLLAITLTLIFAFSCFSILGVGAAEVIAEETNTSNQRVLIEKGFGENTGWTDNNAHTKLDLVSVEKDAETNEEYIKILSDKKMKPFVFSPVVNVVANRSYEISFYLKTDSDWYYKAYPMISLMNVDGIMVDPTTDPGATKNFYANSSNSNHEFFQEDFDPIWQVEGFEHVRPGCYSCLSFNTTNGALEFKNIIGGQNFNTVFANKWKKVTVKFTGTLMEEGSIALSQPFAVAIGYAFGYDSGDKVLPLYIKDFELKELNYTEEKTIFESENWDNREAINVTLFDGATVNQDSTNFGFFDDSEGDYVQISTSSGVRNTLATTPIDIIPGNDYEITYDLRIHPDSATYDYVQAGKPYCMIPSTNIYEITDKQIKNDKVTVRPETATSYAYYISKENSEYGYSISRRYDPKNKIKFLISGTFKYGETEKAISRMHFSAYNYQSASVDFGSTTDIKDEFGDSWVRVTIKFTGWASATNPGAQKAAVAIMSPDATKEGYIFQIRNLKVKEYPFLEPAPLVICNKDFNDKTQPIKNNALSIYSTNNPIYTEGAEFEIYSNRTAYRDNGAILALSRNDLNIVFPINKNLLNGKEKYEFSFRWKLINTVTSKKFLTEVALVGYNNIKDFTDHTVIATAFEGESEATDGWVYFDKFKAILNSSTDKFENYGLMINYRIDYTNGVVKDSDSVFDDGLLIDDVVVSYCGKMKSNDFDLDDKVGLTDVTALAKYFAGWETPDVQFIDEDLANVNGDGATNLFDLVHLARVLAGWYN